MLDLDYSDIKNVIMNIDFSSQVMDHCFDINDEIKANVRVTSNEIIFNLSVNGWWATDAAELRYRYHQDHQENTTLSFAGINSSSGGTTPAAPNTTQQQAECYAYKNKATALIALTMICDILEESGNTVKQQLTEKIRLDKEDQKKRWEQAMKQREEHAAAHDEAVKKFNESHDVIQDEKAAMAVLDNIKKTANPFDKCQVLFINENSLEINTHEFGVYPLQNGIGFLDKQGKRISQKNLANQIIGTAVTKVSE